MAGVVMMFLGIVVLGAVGVYVIFREIRRLVQLRRARLSRVYQLERQVKGLIGRIRQLEGTTTRGSPAAFDASSEAVRLISSYRLSSADSSVARLLRHMEQRAEALHLELGFLALQANAFIECDVEDVRKNVEEHAKRIVAEETQ